MAHLPPVADIISALAKADFTEIAACFSMAGLSVHLPAEGILQIRKEDAATPSCERGSLLLSVGIHGDETAPIEILGHLLFPLMQAPQELSVDLMIVIGNLDAIAQQRRYIDADLNRLFRAERGALPAVTERKRAETIMRCVASFFALSHGPKWHLDLHTAIRASYYRTFAIVPDLLDEPTKTLLTAWLGGAGIDAVIFNQKQAGTFSAYTAAQFGVGSCTIELGQAGALGKNDLTPFFATQRALDALLRSGPVAPVGEHWPELFTVAQEIIKHSNDFTLAFDRTVKNFTLMPPGAAIAHDGEVVYCVGDETEYVVFPNPDVNIGQRAGLMVVRKK